MKYEAVIQDFLREFPEFSKTLDDRMRNWGPELKKNLSPYVFFGSVVNPHLEEELEKSKRDEGLLKRIFSFFERMALSKDKMAYELLGVGITEVLGDNPTRLKTARKYMGPGTRKNSDEMEKYWGRLYNFESL